MAGKSHVCKRRVKSFNLCNGNYVSRNLLMLTWDFCALNFAVGRLTLRLDNDPVSNFHLINAVAITV